MAAVADLPYLFVCEAAAVVMLVNVMVLRSWVAAAAVVPVLASVGVAMMVKTRTTRW